MGEVLDKGVDHEEGVGEIQLEKEVLESKRVVGLVGQGHSSS